LYTLSSTPNTYITSYSIDGLVSVSVTVFLWMTAMHAVTQSPAPVTSVVKGTPVGTPPPLGDHTPKASSPPNSTTAEPARVFVSSQSSVSLCVKPTLVCLISSASANTYTTNSVASKPEKATTAGGPLGSSPNVTGANVSHGTCLVGTHPRSAYCFTYVLMEP
jgi:hypothetical protein